MMMIITMLLKTIPTARGAQSLQRMDSACLFLLFKLLGKVFRTMTITKGLWGRATLTMDQKFEIGTPLMRNFLFFSFPSFFFFFLLSSYPNVCFVVGFSQQGFKMNFHKILKTFSQHPVANLILVS